MTRIAPCRLSVLLITLGDPDTPTGGYLYHRRLAELAPRHGARLVFGSFPAWPFPFPVLAGPRLVRSMSRRRPDVIVLDSIAAAFLAPWLPVIRGPVVAVRLHLAGDDRAEPRYAARVARRLARGDLAGRVECHGHLGREQVAALYRDADVFVLPSFREPYGTVYGEAMAAGLPVVGWRAGNLPYLAGHGREGLLAEPGDVAGLAGALCLLAEDGQLRARLGAAARRRAAAFPTWEQTAARFFAAAREAAGLAP